MPDQTDTPPKAPRRPAAKGRKEKLVVVRYGRMKHVGLFRHHLDATPGPGTMLVVRSERGTELGRVLVNVGDGDAAGFIRKDELDGYLRANGPDYPFRQGGRALRLANPQDINDQQHLDRSAHEEDSFCREQIEGLALEMKLVEVEHLLGGERIVFYFTAEHRVDFRELVKQMAGRYHTRIEMRQVGARDEARLMADYERCGRHCCCKQFLKFLKPISMRMAKMQKATLDPTKISGRCGRLMCCLRYEDSTYEQMQTALPRKNKWVRTSDGVVGKVVDVQVLTQLVVLMTPARQRVVVANEEIVERDIPQPLPPETPDAETPQPTPRPAPPQPRKQDRVDLDQLDEKLADMQAEAAAEPPPPEAAESPERAPPTKRRRGRRRRRPRKKPSGAPSAGSGVPAPAAPGKKTDRPPRTGRKDQAGPPTKRRKKRRRRKKRPDGPSGPAGGSPSTPPAS